MNDTDVVTREFHAALEHWVSLQNTGKADTAEGYETWEIVWNEAPEWFRQKTRELMRGTGLIPHPVGYDADGNPVYKLADVAERMGTTQEALLEKHPHMASTEPFHRIN